VSRALLRVMFQDIVMHDADWHMIVNSERYSDDELINLEIRFVPEDLIYDIRDTVVDDFLDGRIALAYLPTISRIIIVPLKNSHIYDFKGKFASDIFKLECKTCNGTGRIAEAGIGIKCYDCKGRGSV